MTEPEDQSPAIHQVGIAFSQTLSRPIHRGSDRIRWRGRQRGVRLHESFYRTGENLVNALLQCDPSGLPKTRGLLILVSTILLASGAAAQTTPESPRVDFVRDVRPLLAEHCFACHGPDEKHRQADVRLDRHDDALKTVVAGDPQQSLLVQRITSADPMDPAGSRMGRTLGV